MNVKVKVQKVNGEFYTIEAKCLQDVLDRIESGETMLVAPGENYDAVRIKKDTSIRGISVRS